MSISRFVRRALTGLILLLIVAAAVSLSMSRIETTNTGVHQRLLVPIGVGVAKVAMPAGTGDAPKLTGFLDGPVVTPTRTGWLARWFCEQEVVERTGAGDQLVIECAGKQHAFRMQPLMTRPAASVISMPQRMLVLSDIEGNLSYLERALANLQVTGTDGKWAFGTGHLVIAGDSVDRGRDVFAVLWRLYGLSQQAREAGGQVHVVLGNHEQYVLRGNTSRAHPEHVYALDQLGGPGAAFGSETVIGNWLRHQGVVLKAGKVLIAHGGISLAVVAQKLSLEQINDGMYRYWKGEQASAAQLDAALGPQGVTQYRGYLMEMEGQYALATDADIDAVAKAYDVQHVVVGHSIVEKVTGLFGNRVYAIDVNSNTAASEALMFVDGIPKVVDTGAPRRLAEGKGEGKIRPINLLAANDWQALSRMVSRSYELASLPHPY